MDIPEHLRVLKDDGTLDLEETLAKVEKSYIALLKDQFPRVIAPEPGLDDWLDICAPEK